MRKIAILLTMLCTLSGCIHKINIEQGNVITQQQVAQLHPGMTEAQIKAIMGDPVLINTFNDRRLDYVYTYKPGGGTMTEKYVTLTLQNGRLKTISGNLYSQYLIH